MSLIKSVSVGVGDMYYVRHGSDNFTMIDCMLPMDELWRKQIVDELITQAADKGITRFISTHPDQDHVQGLKYLDSRMGIVNFYCIKNQTTKEYPTEDFLHYTKLRDDPAKAYYIYNGCSRRWMNQHSEDRGSAGINILWPDTSNAAFKDALAASERAESPNNTSAIIKYAINRGVTAIWFGDLETDFMEDVDGEVDLPKVDLLFAPHHGRTSGRLPDSWLSKLNPTVIVLGEAPAENLHYYPGWNTITQNSALDITFDCVQGRVDVFVSSTTYDVDFVYDAGIGNVHDRYIGSFDV